MHLDLYTYRPSPPGVISSASYVSQYTEHVDVITFTNTPVKKLMTNTSIGIHNPMPPPLFSCSNTALEVHFIIYSMNHDLSSLRTP